MRKEKENSVSSSIPKRRRGNNMPTKLAEKLSYSYDFQSDELKPMIETIPVQESDPFSIFGEREDLKESIIKDVKEESVLLADAQSSEGSGDTKSSVESGSEKEDKEDRKYSLTYYNPLLKKAEVLAVTSTIKIKDQVKKNVEESVGERSTYPIYEYVANPIMSKEINPYILQDIRDNMEFMTPPKFGAASMVKAPGPQSKIVAVDQKQVARDAVMESVQRKEKAQTEVESEIVTIQKVQEEIREHRKSTEKALEDLPGLTKERFLAVYRKKKLSDSQLLRLLEKDVSFLKSMRNKLKNLSVEELIELAKTLKKLVMR
jgi:hypothetical protein